jgi:hypothetical protein
MRTTLPLFAASMAAQPETHETAVIFAGSEAYVPPEPADAPAGAASPTPQTTATTIRFSSTSPLVCCLRG